MDIIMFVLAAAALMPIIIGNDRPLNNHDNRGSPLYFPIKNK